MRYPRRTVQEHFWSFIGDPPGPDVCWPWGGGVSNAGYGRFQCERAHYAAHRVSYQLFHGHIPGGMVVRHKCDNKICVNPAHLEIGTPQDNVRDRVQRGRCCRGDRHPTRTGKAHWLPRGPAHRWYGKKMPHRGESNGMAKLTEAQVLEIIADTKPVARVLAARYGVCPATIHLIRNGTSWSYLPRPNQLTTTKEPT
jgi:hypothetical protein